MTTPWTPWTFCGVMMSRKEEIYDRLKQPVGSHAKWLFVDDVVGDKVLTGEIGQLYGVKIVTSRFVEESHRED